MDQCAEIMLTEVLEHLKMRTSLEKITFVLYDEPTLKVFEETYRKLSGQPPI